MKIFFFVALAHFFLLLLECHSLRVDVQVKKEKSLEVRRVDPPPPPPPPPPLPPEPPKEDPPPPPPQVKAMEVEIPVVETQEDIPQIVQKEEPAEAVSVDTLSEVVEALIPRQQVTLFHMSQKDSLGNFMAAFPQVARWKDCQGAIEVDMLIGKNGKVVDRRDWKFEGDGMVFQYEIFNLFKYLEYPPRVADTGDTLLYWMHKRWDFRLKPKSEEGWWERKFPKHCNEYSSPPATSKTMVNPDKKVGSNKPEVIDPTAH